jgi:tetratricopeptide (TPR) repeat protein
MRYSAKLLGLVGATAIMMPVIQLPGLSEEPRYLEPATLAQTQTPEAEENSAHESLLQEGRVLYYQGNFAQALEVLQAALGQYQALGDTPEHYRGEVESLIAIAEVYLLINRDDEALQLANRALEIARAHQNVAGQAWALNILGDVQNSSGDIEEALAQYQQALQLSQTLGDVVIQGVALTNLGAVYASQGDFTAAQEQFRQALEFLQHSVLSPETELRRQYYQAIAFQWAGGGLLAQRILIMQLILLINH